MLPLSKPLSLVTKSTLPSPASGLACENIFTVPPPIPLSETRAFLPRGEGVGGAHNLCPFHHHVLDALPVARCKVPCTEEGDLQRNVIGEGVDNLHTAQQKCGLLKQLASLLVVMTCCALRYATCECKDKQSHGWSFQRSVPCQHHKTFAMSIP